VPEIVADGETAVLVGAAPRPEELATAIAGLLGDPARRASMATAARARYAERFSAAAWARRMRAVYEQAIADRPQGRRAPRG
jgi:glycosyltransferase involved in cell wall biosynthesis